MTHNGVDILKKQFKAGTKEQISENRVVKEGDKYLATEPERKSRAEYKSGTVYQTGEFRINNIKESKDEFDSTQFIVLAKDLVLEADQSKRIATRFGLKEARLKIQEYYTLVRTSLKITQELFKRIDGEF